MNNIINLLKKPNEEEIYQFERESSPLKFTGLSTLYDKFIVHKIAKMLPSGSIAVEVGTYLGASAALMAHANNNLIVHSYDLFDDVKYDIRHDSLITKSLGEGKKRTIENVSIFLSRYSNIILHKVDPTKKIQFDYLIDMFIEDSSHKDPQLSESLNFWLPKIKINGYILIHDFRPWLPVDSSLRHIDVEKYVTLLSKNNDFNYLGNFGCFAIFQRTNNFVL